VGEDSCEHCTPSNALAWVNGSDAPENQPEHRLHGPDRLRLGRGRRHPGLRPATRPDPQPQAPGSWAGLRDKLVSGELDAAHCLYGLVYAVHLGIGGVPASDMAVLMGLNQNAQASTCPRPCSARA
jgi:nitrate/nitrite transport system substrate-binding protein